MCRDGKIDPLTAIHQAAEYQQHLARLIELVLAPARHSVEASQLQAQIQQQQLRDVRDRLEVQRGRAFRTRHLLLYQVSCTILPVGV